jgi:hypothetical protein
VSLAFFHAYNETDYHFYGSAATAHPTTPPDSPIQEKSYTPLHKIPIRGVRYTKDGLRLVYRVTTPPPVILVLLLI